jgi:hypothetical protein
LINLAALAVGAMMAAKLASGPALSNREVLVGVIATAVIARFALDNFQWGQVNLVVMSLAVAHVYLYSKGSRLASGLALALAVWIKLTPAVLLGYHLARLRLKFTAACMLMIAGVGALSFAQFGGSAVPVLGAFVSRTIQNGQGFDLSYSGNQSLRGLEARFAEETRGQAQRPATVFSICASAVLLILAAVAAYKAPGEAAAASPFLCCSLIVSPLSWKGHFVILLLPIASLAHRFLVARFGINKYGPGLVLLLAFVILNGTSFGVSGEKIAQWADDNSLILSTALLVYLATIWICLKQDPGSEGSLRQLECNW